MGDMNKYGIGFWIGGGVYSIINMIMNYNNALQSKILFYNYLITGVAIFGLALNLILLKRTKK
jgi:F0F1-type ATP synthase membrane subunit c/vacuolar-type H+-ATPase subunit K